MKEGGIGLLCIFGWNLEVENPAFQCNSPQGALGTENVFRSPILF